MISLNFLGTKCQDWRNGISSVTTAIETWIFLTCLVLHRDAFRFAFPNTVREGRSWRSCRGPYAPGSRSLLCFRTPLFQDNRIDQNEVPLAITVLRAHRNRRPASVRTAVVARDFCGVCYLDYGGRTLRRHRSGAWLDHTWSEI